jgi:site-specific recombinase XerD
MNIEEFINRYPCKNTKRNYRRIIKSYFEIVGVSQDSYFNDNRDYEKDIEKFFQYKMEMKYAPKTLNSDLGCLKKFLLCNRVEVSDFVWTDMRGRLGDTTFGKTRDANIKQEDIKAILSHMGIRGRALFLTMVSSGMRIGETNEIKLTDIHLDENPVRIIVRAENTKNKITRTVFISQEAKVAIQEWLKVRDAYLKRVSSEGTKRIVNKITKNEDRLFPFSPTASRLIWTDALRKAGLEEFDKSCGALLRMKRAKKGGYCEGRRTMHPHSLRQYFRSRIGTVVGQDISEALMGHKKGIVAIYTRYQRGGEDELAKAYKENIEDKISIFSNPRELQQIREKSKKQGLEIEQHRESISHMAHQNLSLERKVGDLESDSQRIRDLENEIIKMKHMTRLFRDFSIQQYKELQEKSQA